MEWTNSTRTHGCFKLTGSVEDWAVEKEVADLPISIIEDAPAMENRNAAAVDNCASSHGAFSPARDVLIKPSYG
jgi:hypothetical protein